LLLSQFLLESDLDFWGIGEMIFCYQQDIGFLSNFQIKGFLPLTYRINLFLKFKFGRILIFKIKYFLKMLNFAEKRGELIQTLKVQCNQVLQ
jgi:hypothetical protein